MKDLLRSLAMAFSMYSILPAPRVDWKPENMRYAFCFFPLVGAVIGAAEYGWLWLCRLFGVGPGLTAAVATAIPVVISGGIHLDGFCDVSDALASHAPAERKLEIMKDPHIGAFGVMACVLCLLLTFGLWTQYRFHPRTAGVLAAGFVLSRSLSGFTVVSMRCAKPSGLASLFAENAAKGRVRALLAVLALLCAAVMLALSPPAGAAGLLAALVVLLHYRWLAYRCFGGITGDLAGYFLTVCEAAVLAAAVLFEGVLL